MSDKIANGKRRPRRGPVLMSDVAARAGVVKSTVSRALSNPNRVSKDILERVLTAAKELGYTPNAAAQSLRGRKLSTVMIILPGPSVSYGASVVIPQALEGIASVLSNAGFNVQIVNMNRSESSERHIVDLAFSGTIRGSILVSSTDMPSIDGRRLDQAAVPIVALFQDLSAAGVESVVTNDRQAMRLAASHLIELGHRSFFYIAGPRGNYHEVERFRGIQDALSANGIPEDAVTRFDEDLQFQDGLENGAAAARTFLDMANHPTAALSCSDDAAIAFMTIVRRMGICIPDALSVVGFDGTPVGFFCEPPLTTLRQPALEMGRRAAELLLDAISKMETGRRTASKRSASPHVIDSVLLMRASTGPTPLFDGVIVEGDSEAGVSGGGIGMSARP